MRLKPLVTALCAGALLAAAPFAQAKELKSIGVTVGDLALAAKELGMNVLPYYRQGYVHVEVNG